MVAKVISFIGNILLACFLLLSAFSIAFGFVRLLKWVTGW